MSTTAEMVSVPARLLNELMRYLPDQVEGVEVAGGNGRWTADMIERLRSEIDRYPAAKAVLDQTAARPGELVSLTQIEHASGVSRDRFKPELGAMSKVAKRLFDHKVWPVQATQGGDGMYYVMPPRIAQWWTANARNQPKSAANDQ